MSPSKILLIDDEVELCQLLKEFFREEGYLMECAQDGEEGIEKVKQFQPDLILLDIRMPKKDGFFFLEKLKNLGLYTVAVVSALQDPKTIEKCKDFGVKYFSSKPIDLTEIKTLIENALENNSPTLT